LGVSVKELFGREKVGAEALSFKMHFTRGTSQKKKNPDPEFGVLGLAVAGRSCPN